MSHVDHSCYPDFAEFSNIGIYRENEKVFSISATMSSVVCSGLHSFLACNAVLLWHFANCMYNQCSSIRSDSMWCTPGTHLIFFLWITWGVWLLSQEILVGSLLGYPVMTVDFFLQYLTTNTQVRYVDSSATASCHMNHSLCSSMQTDTSEFHKRQSNI